MKNLIFLDCEAHGASPVSGTLTEFGAVHYPSLISFHGRLFEGTPDPENPAVPVPGKRLAGDAEIAGAFTSWLTACCGNARPIFVSDNPAYDWQWISGMYDRAAMDNPFGHSGRRISDFWAGLSQDWGNTQGWKKYRKTKHDHNPVNDAMGNAEAFTRIIQMMREGKFHEI